MVVLAIMLFPTTFFTSCEKTTTEKQTFDDVFDTSQIQALNSIVENSSTLSDLPDEFNQVEIKMHDDLNNLDINNIVSSMEQKIKFSKSEVDLLLQNDVATYIKVVNRLNSLPAQLEGIEVNFPVLENSPLNKYDLIQKEELTNYYTNDYYHAALELQDYMKNKVILPLRNLNKLVENTNSLKSASTNDKDDKNKCNSVVANIFKNIFDLISRILECILGNSHYGGAVH